MNSSQRLRAGITGAVLVAGTLVVHGVASTNTVTYQESGSIGGLGAGTVSRLDVLSVEPTFDSIDKSQVTSVRFTFNAAVLAAGSDAVAYAQHNGATWTACGPILNGSTSVSCPITDTYENFGKTSGGDPAPLILALAE